MATMTRIAVTAMTNTLERGILENGGATVSPSGIVPDSGWAVALPGLGWVQAYDGSELDRILLRPDVRAWLKARKADLAWQGRYAGAWVDKGNLYLDMVEIRQDKEDALQRARARGELAVFNLATREEARTYTRQDSIDILRMYLEGNSAHDIAGTLDFPVRLVQQILDRS